MQRSPKLHEELERAAAAIAGIEASTTLDDAERHWKDFLGKLERVWFKAQAHFGKSPKWSGWKGKYERARDTDPLLCYLRHARGAEEHTLTDIVELKPGTIGIRAGPTGSAHIRSLAIDKGQVTFDGEGSIQVALTPGTIQLLPVTNRGRTYPVPTSHLGAPIESQNFMVVAKAGVKYYESMMIEAEKFFIK